MTRIERCAVAAIREVCEPAGCTCELTRGRHLGVVVTAPDGTWAKIPVAGSPRSDQSNGTTSRQHAQRFLRTVASRARASEAQP